MTTNLVIEITVPVASDDVIAQAGVLAGLKGALDIFKEALPDNAVCVTRLTRLRAEPATPTAPRRSRAANNGATVQPPAAT